MTAIEIVNQAASRGYTVNVRQLESLRYLGVLRKGAQRGLGQAVGSAWLYPSGTIDRLIVFLELRRPKETLPETAVRLWLRDYDFDLLKLRRCISEALVVHRRIKSKVQELGPVEFGEKLVDHAVRNPLLGEGYGATSTERYDRIQRIGEVVATVFTEDAGPLSPDAVALIEQQMKVNDSTTAVLGAFNTNLQDELSKAMPLIASADMALEEATDEQLFAGREMLKAIEEIYAAFVRLPPEFPPRQFISFLCEHRDSAFALSMHVQTLRRLNGISLNEAVERMRSVATTLTGVAQKMSAGGA